jgi:hypothetical protein
MFAVAASNVNGGLVSFFHGVQVAVMFALMTNILQFAWWKVKGKKNLSHWKKNRPLYLLVLAMFLVCTQPVCMLVIGSWEDMPNFFFDGGDMGAPCVVGSTCASKSCGGALNDAGINPALVDSNWRLTGCTTATPDWAYIFYTDGGAASMYTDYCKANATSVEYKTCAPNSSASCKLQPTPDDPTSCSVGDTKCTCGMDSNALVPNTTIGWCIQIFGTYGGFIVMFFGVFEATNLHKKIMNKFKALRN